MTQNRIKPGSYVVYPAHGVGTLVGYETHNIAGMEVELVVISFEKERMTLRLPEAKAYAAGLRSLVSRDELEEALEALKIKTRIKKAMWGRRAQEYEAKINSGNLVSLAEVLRELFRSQRETEQSYSERQIYQAALERFSREFCAVEKIEEPEAIKQIENILSVA